MNRWKRWMGACALLLSGVAMGQAQQGGAGAAKGVYPYTFANLVWWSDAELRAELHKRAPRLGDTIAPGSREEDKIRDVLKAMLKKKGIHAEVQSVEPSTSLQRLEHVPEEPPVSIVFHVTAPPKIVVGSVDVPAELREIAEHLAGRVYDRGRFWMEEDAMMRVYRDRGYLTAKVRLEPGLPLRQNEGWAVSLKAVVEQGPLFHVGTVKVDGGPLLEGRNLQRFVAVHPGEVARGSSMGRLGLAVGQFYRNQGYADVQVRVEPELDREHSVANYLFRTDPGEQYHVRMVSVEGLTVAQTGEVRAMLGLVEGDVFNLSKLQGVERAMKSSPGMVGETYSFSYVKDKEKAMVDLRLEFRKARS